MKFERIAGSNIENTYRYSFIDRLKHKIWKFFFYING